MSSEGEFDERLQGFLGNSKTGNAVSSFDATLGAVFKLRNLVASTHWSNAEDLMKLIREVGKHLATFERGESPILNIVRRILKLVRDEHVDMSGNKKTGNESLQNILMVSKNQSEVLTHSTHGLKSSIIDSINELVSELETCGDNIAAQALEYIHSNEIVMTLGWCQTVEKFLKNAGRKRKFTVVVAENAPFFDGQKLASSLAESNISATVIADSAIFAVMSRINKVIIGANLVFADGGLLAANGTQTIALAAKHHSVPLIVCAGLFKVSPKFVSSYNQDNQITFLSPSPIGKFDEIKSSERVTVCNPSMDLIQPNLVDLFISDVGGNVPSYLYRLLSEMYNLQDYML